jgi:transposase
VQRAATSAQRRSEVQDCWVAKEKVRDIYLTDDVVEAERALDDAVVWCTAPESGKELRRLAKTLWRWRREILAHHTTGASNGPIETANLSIKQVKRNGRGFRNFDNYRLRIMRAGGHRREAHTVTRLRARPSSVA